MKILNAFKRAFNRSSYRNRILRDNYVYSDLDITHYQFGKICFYNILHILTSLVDDVELYRTSKKQDAMEFAYFRRFFEMYGQQVLDELYTQGYCVIKLPKNNSLMTSGYRILNRNEYEIQTSDINKFIVVPISLDQDEIYVMKSDTFSELGISDEQFLHPVLKYIDNLLNASNTLTERFGTLVVASPKNLNSAPTSIVLTEEDKKELEEEMSKQYGSLRNQKQVMLLPREMTFDQINLSGVDQKLEEKLRIALELIADRLKVPACRISIIDAQSSKALSNGSEIVAGDMLLYKSFERLLNRSFILMADDLGLKIDYNIYNKPVDNQGEVING